LTRKQKLFVWALPAAALLAASGLAYDWYYRARIWPAELQQQLLGAEIVRSDALIDREGSSAYGEGRFRWRYRLDPRDPRLKKFCPAARAPGDCRFARSRRIAEGVDIYVSYSGGVMTFEEYWS
jgi:hypothetical protein